MMMVNETATETIMSMGSGGQNHNNDKIEYTLVWTAPGSKLVIETLPTLH